MLEHPSIKIAKQTCGACPDQWQGELFDGLFFYFRYRHGVASLAIATTQEECDGRQDVRMMHGDNWQGVFDSDAERNTVFAALYEAEDE